MTVSDYIANTVLTRFPAAKGKITTVYSGVDLNSYTTAWSKKGAILQERMRAHYGVADKKVVLFVGRLSKTKGPDVLIDAMKHVIEKHPDAVLVIVGSKWFSDERINKYGAKIREKAKAFGDKIHFTGFVPPNQLPSIFLLGNIFVCSSQWQEPLARVHYEAMAAGTPVVTTNRGGNKEIIAHRKNGWLIDDYTNPKAFAEAISYLLTHPNEALKLAQAGRVFVENNHGFEQVAKRLQAVYNGVMQNPKPTK